EPTPLTLAERLAVVDEALATGDREALRTGESLLCSDLWPIALRLREAGARVMPATNRVRRAVVGVGRGRRRPRSSLLPPRAPGRRARRPPCAAEVGRLWRGPRADPGAQPDLRTVRVSQAPHAEWVGRLRALR